MRILLAVLIVTLFPLSVGAERCQNKEDCVWTNHGWNMEGCGLFTKCEQPKDDKPKQICFDLDTSMNSIKIATESQDDKAEADIRRVIGKWDGHIWCGDQFVTYPCDDLSTESKTKEWREKCDKAIKEAEDKCSMRWSNGSCNGKPESQQAAELSKANTYCTRALLEEIEK